MTDRAPIDVALAAGNRPSPRRAPIRPDTRKIEIPLDHQPGAILGEGPSAASARLAMEGVRSAWEQIRDAAADETVELPRLAEAAQGAMKRALSSADKSANSIASHIDALNREIDRAIMPRVTDAYDELMRKLPFLAEHYEDVHGVPLTREIVQGRFHTTRAKVRSWPRTSVVARQYWPVARVLARVDGPISRERLEALARLFDT